MPTNQQNLAKVERDFRSSVTSKYGRKKGEGGRKEARKDRFSREEERGRNVIKERD